MSVIKENLPNLQSSPEDDSDDRQYTDEKVVPLMLVFLSAAAQQNKTHFKLSECKETMPTIAEKYLQLGVELLVERGFVKAPVGRSRVPLYEISVTAVPKPAAAAAAAAAAASAPAARETKKPKAAKDVKETKKKDEQKKSENELNLEKADEEKIVLGKKRKSEPLAETERANQQSQPMVSPPSAKKKKAEKKVYISFPAVANTTATAAPADDIEASELEGEVEKFDEKEAMETTKPAYAALFEPPAKSDEEKAQEEREKQLEQAVADRLLALQVDSAPLSLFVQSVLVDRPQFSEEDVRRMLDVFQDRNNIMLDGEMIYVI